MSLTDPWLLVVIGVLALAALVVLALGLPRTTRRWTGAVVRGGEGLVLSMLVVTLAAAALNDQYSFYVSWADLFGATSPSTSVQAGGSANTAVTAKAQGPGFSQFLKIPPSTTGTPVPGMRLQNFAVTGARSGLRGEVLVYLPAGYDQRSARRYPVILALHGFPGNPAVWLNTIHVNTVVDTLEAQHKLAQSIIVIPQINDPISVDTECVNAPVGKGPQAETWLAQDVPAWVVSHLRVQTARTSWAVAGYSFGGWCAAMLGSRHPDVFGAAVVFQGYFRPDFSAGYNPLPTGSPVARGYDLVRAVQANPPPLAMWVLTTKADGLSYPTTAAFLKNVRPPLSVR